MTTRDDCLAALREAAARLCESPTKAQYEGLELTPASSTIRRLFGSWNEAKARADLETHGQRPGRDGSIQPQPDDVTLPDGYEWVDLTPQQRWYYKNRRARVERKEERRRALREWFQSYKRDHCACAECGESHPACLDFHHDDEAEKTASISEMVNDGYSKERILGEMAACTVLCATCHRQVHNEAGLGSASDPPDSRRRVSGRPRTSGRVTGVRGVTSRVRGASTSTTPTRNTTGSRGWSPTAVHSAPSKVNSNGASSSVRTVIGRNTTTARGPRTPEPFRNIHTRRMATPGRLQRRELVHWGSWPILSASGADDPGSNPGWTTPPALSSDSSAHVAGVEAPATPTANC